MWFISSVVSVYDETLWAVLLRISWPLDFLIFAGFYRILSSSFHNGLITLNQLFLMAILSWCISALYMIKFKDVINCIFKDWIPFCDFIIKFKDVFSFIFNDWISFCDFFFSCFDCISLSKTILAICLFNL